MVTSFCQQFFRNKMAKLARLDTDVIEKEEQTIFKITAL